MKQMGQMLADIFLIIVFEASKTAGMKQNENDYNFRITHTVRLVSMLMRCILKHPLAEFKYVSGNFGVAKVHVCVAKP